MMSLALMSSQQKHREITRIANLSVHFINDKLKSTNFFNKTFDSIINLHMWCVCFIFLDDSRGSVTVARRESYEKVVWHERQIRKLETKHFYKYLQVTLSTLLSLHEKSKGCRKAAVTFILIGRQKNSCKSSGNFLWFRVILRSSFLGLQTQKGKSCSKMIDSF